MEKLLDGTEPINPQIESVSHGDIVEIRTNPLFPGLNLRQHYAGLAMQGLIAKYNLKEPSDQQVVAQLSVELADTLITELNR